MFNGVPRVKNYLPKISRMLISAHLKLKEQIKSCLALACSNNL